MEDKKRFRFLRELPRRRLLMLALIFIVVSIVGVWAGNVVFRQGDLTVDGKLGVGTTAPQRTLHISHSDMGTTTLAAFENTDTTPGNGITLSFRTTTTGAGGQPFQELGAIVGKVNNHDYATRRLDIEFWNAINGAWAPHLIIKDNGRVGIGDVRSPANPQAPLHVTGGLSSTGVVARFERDMTGVSGPAGWAGVIELATGSATGSNNPFVRYGILGSRDAASVDTLTRFWLSVNKDSTTPWNDGHFVIDSTGKVGIGTTTPQRALHISNVMRLEPRAAPPSSAAMGDIYVDTSGTLCFYDGTVWQKSAGTGTCA